MTRTAPTRMGAGLAVVVLAISGCATVAEHPPRTAAGATPAFYRTLGPHHDPFYRALDKLARTGAGAV